MDGVDAEELEVAQRAACGVTNGDVTVRGRWMGRSLLLEVDVPLPADVPVGDAETIGREVETAIFAAVPAARRVTCRMSSAAQREAS
jgi:divalent metal cation (Fe/Co/Zn/Cd) transporter